MPAGILGTGAGSETIPAKYACVFLEGDGMRDEPFLNKSDEWEGLPANPCPYCGGKAAPAVTIPRTGEKAQYYVRCIRCGARSPELQTSRDYAAPKDEAQANAAVKSWNRICKQMKEEDYQSSLILENVTKKKIDRRKRRKRACGEA